MPDKIFKLLKDTLKIANETAPLRGGKQLWVAKNADPAYGKQYQKWKKDNPQIDWKKKEAEWSKK